MSDSISLPPDTGATDGAHYLRALTDMADRRTVVAGAAIYAENGIKLVEKGARIDSRLYDRLVQHKLREPVDSHLTVENPVDVAALVATVQALVEEDPLTNLLAQALGSGAPLLAPLRAVVLPPSMACKLTVMRDQRPALFQHSLRMAAVALFLAIRSEMSERDCATVAAAALLHDLGVLHMEPAWSDPGNKVVGAQRKHLVAHPITAMLLIRDTQAYPKAVEVAVLEHHELMDGTGYPRSIPGAQISPIGRILLLSEVVSAFYEKYDDMPAQRLSLVLRLNHRKFPSALVAHLLPLLQEEVTRDSALMPLGNDVPRLIEVLTEAFTTWERLKSAVPAEARGVPGSAFAFAEARLMGLQKALLEAGSHPQQQNELMPHLQGDTVGMAEVALLGREAMWQLQSTLNACHRRWPQLADSSAPGDTAVADWCDWAMRRL